MDNDAAKSMLLLRRCMGFHFTGTVSVSTTLFFVFVYHILGQVAQIRGQKEGPGRRMFHI